MESFYLQLLIVLVTIVSVLICILVYRKISQALQNGGNDKAREDTSKQTRVQFEKKMHPRVSRHEGVESTEVNGDG